MKQKIIILIILFINIGNLVAQKQISGKVTYSDGDVIPGCSVVIKGTTTGTITDFNGGFVLNVKESDILVFSFVGCITQEVYVSSSNYYNLQLIQNESGYDYVNYGSIILPNRKTISFKNKKYENFDLPNKKFNSEKIFSFGIYRGLSINYGFHKTSFLNPIFGQNISENKINSKFGTFFNIRYLANLGLPFKIDITHFRSKFSYDINPNLQDNSSIYKGWEFCFSTYFFPNIPFIKYVINSNNTYLGLGYHIGKIDNVIPYFEPATILDNKVNTAFWKIGYQLFPFRLLTENVSWDFDFEDKLNRIGLIAEYNQSLKVNIPKSFNQFSLSLSYIPDKDDFDFSGIRRKFRYFSFGDLDDLPGSDGENADYMKQKFGFFSYGYIGTNFLNTKFRSGRNDFTIDKNWGHNIVFKYTYFYPLMIDASYFISNMKKFTNTYPAGLDSVMIRHQGLEISPTYGITSIVKWAIPYAGFGMQLSGLSNKSTVLACDNPENKIVSGFVWKFGILTNISNYLITTEFKRSILKSDTKFNQFSITFGYNLNWDNY